MILILMLLQKKIINEVTDEVTDEICVDKNNEVIQIEVHMNKYGLKKRLKIKLLILILLKRNHYKIRCLIII